MNNSGKFVKQPGKNKHKRMKTSEGEPNSSRLQEDEGDSFRDHGSFGEDPVDFQNNKDPNSFAGRDERNISKQRKNNSKPVENFQNKNHSPNQDGAIRFNLPENRTMNYNQPSPNPIPVRKDVNFVNNMGGYQEMTAGTADPQQSGPYNMNRNTMFSPMPFIQNRSPGVSPNMVPMYSPMVMKSDNFRDYSSRNIPNMQRDPTVMGQSSSTPVNKTDIPYGDYYPVNASPSGYTPMRTNLNRFNPGFSPSHQPDASGFFGPSPNMMPGLSFPYQMGKTPVNQFPNNEMFATPKPMNPSNPQMNDRGNGKEQEAEGVFRLNPFGP